LWCSFRNLWVNERAFVRNKGFLADGNEVVFGALTNEEFEAKCNGVNVSELEQNIYLQAKTILSNQTNRDLLMQPAYARLRYAFASQRKFTQRQLASVRMYAANAVPCVLCMRRWLFAAGNVRLCAVLCAFYSSKWQRTKQAASGWLRFAALRRAARGVLCCMAASMASAKRCGA
jgi:hypothetical protein